jgi:hypothetical protein
MNTKVKRYKGTGLTACTVAIAVAALSSPLAMSDKGKHGPSCNAATIRGDYGIQMEGTRPTPPPNVGIETVIGVVWRRYDGNGNFEQLDSVKGSITGIVPNRPGLGTYEVNPDCTGVTSFQPDPNNPFVVIRERLVILDKGKEIRSITETPAPTMVSSVAKRIN